MCNYRTKNGVEHTSRRVMQLGWDNVVTQYINLSGLIKLKMFPCSCGPPCCTPPPQLHQSNHRHCVRKRMGLKNWSAYKEMVGRKTDR